MQSCDSTSTSLTDDEKTALTVSQLTNHPLERQLTNHLLQRQLTNHLLQRQLTNRILQRQLTNGLLQRQLTNRLLQRQLTNHLLQLDIDIIGNRNINAKNLDNKGLHLNPKGTSRLAKKLFKLYKRLLKSKRMTWY